MKVALIGCGSWGKNLARNFHKLGVLSCLHDINSEQAKDVSELYDINIKTYEEILKSDIDAVVIAAPASQHGKIARAALEANKNVFVEKPLSLEVKEAYDLCRLAKEKNKILMVGHLMQYHGSFQKIKEIVNEGRIGKTQYIYSNRLNLGKFRKMFL